MGYVHGCHPPWGNTQDQKNDDDDESAFIVVSLVEAAVKIKKLTITMIAHSLLLSP